MNIVRKPIVDEGVFTETELGLIGSCLFFAHIVEKKDAPGVFGIRNKTDRRWDAVTTKGVARKVAPDEVIPVKPGITFTIENEKITIEAN